MLLYVSIGLLIMKISCSKQYCYFVSSLQYPSYLTQRPKPISWCFSASGVAAIQLNSFSSVRFSASLFRNCVMWIKFIWRKMSSYYWRILIPLLNKTKFLPISAKTHPGLDWLDWHKQWFVILVWRSNLSGVCLEWDHKTT